jgi:hypothetical protein
MIRLSKTGWNNVIIFAVLAFILLVNATNKNVFSSNQASSAKLTILAESAVILTLTINQQININRIGKTWQATPAVIEGQALDQMMLVWQQIEGKPIQQPEYIDQQLGLLIHIDIAGQKAPTVLSLYATDLELLIFNYQTEQWFTLPMQRYQQLLPAALFASN